MVLMLAPTKVSSVGPATKGESVYCSYNRTWKTGKAPEVNCTYSTCFLFSCPGVYKNWGLNLALSRSKTYIPDDRARAVSRDIILFSTIVLSLVLTQRCRVTSQFSMHHTVRPSRWTYYVTIGSGTLAKMKKSFSDTQLCPQQVCMWQQQ